LIKSAAGLTQVVLADQSNIFYFSDNYFHHDCSGGDCSRSYSSDSDPVNRAAGDWTWLKS